MITIDSLSNSMMKGFEQQRIINLSTERALIDDIQSYATILIALANLILIVYIFVRNNKKDALKSEQNRKINLLKTLILDHNLSNLYHFFNDVCSELDGLKKCTLDDIETKEAINEKIQDKAKFLRENFLDLFYAIDIDLYRELLSTIDEMTDSLTNGIFDSGNNLAHNPKFEEIIANPFRKSKSKVLKILFSYTGD
jgi:hypothetical protein